jgi:hypothetical protein
MVCPEYKRININFFTRQSPIIPYHHYRRVEHSKFSGENDMDPGEVYLK